MAISRTCRETLCNMHKMTTGSLGERLRSARERAGYTSAAQAASAMGVPYGTYSGHENNSRGVKREDLMRYARKFKVSPAWLYTGEGAPDSFRVPIVGLAGAGPRGGIDFTYGQGELGEAPDIAGSGESTVAVEVRGDSMRGVADDGWLIYYDDRRNPPTPDLFGQLCIVGIHDGPTLVKYLHPTREPGLFNLESIAAPLMQDVPVEWAAAVVAIVSPRHARRLKAG